MQICQIWKRANSRTFHDLDIKFPELSRTCTDLQNFPGIWKRENIPELSRRRRNHVQMYQCHLHHLMLQSNLEWFDIQVLAYQGCPENRKVCVCVCVCNYVHDTTYHFSQSSSFWNYYTET